MEKIETTIPGCYELQPKIFKDNRGYLIKTFHEDIFKGLGLETNFTEEYYSVSRRNVLRGLHFQIPPDDHVKCLTCLYGKIFDVVVDLRKKSPTFKHHFTIELDSKKGNLLYIPKGLAHGFLVLSEKAIFLNRTTTIYTAESDRGIRWDSCGIDWPSNKPFVSDKDSQMINLKDFKSPF